MSTSAIAGRRARPDISLVSASAEKPTVTRRVVAATVAGNALEFYDFVAYAFFAVYIGKAFFPATTAYASLLLSVAVFGVGFVSRPLGGLLIGAYADRAGRRPAMLLTIALITVGTLGLALTPSYASIGMAALSVRRRPRVALFSTGDELVMPGDVAPADMRPGAIYNSNRFFLRALLLRLGCEVTDLGIVPDRLDATKEALRGAASRQAQLFEAAVSRIGSAAG